MGMPLRVDCRSFFARPVSESSELTMPHQVTLRYDEKLLRRAILGFWWRTLGIRFVIALVVMVTGLIVLVANGDRSWFVGILAAVLAMAFAMTVTLYVVHYRNAFRKLEKMGDPEATLRVTEETLSMSSGAARSPFRGQPLPNSGSFPTSGSCFSRGASSLHFRLPTSHPKLRDLSSNRIQDSGGRGKIA